MTNGKYYLRFLCLLVLFLSLASCGGSGDNADAASLAKPGDIIFQESSSGQSQAIKLATGSSYTHCGIIFEHEGELQVLEASSTVRWYPVRDWVNAGVNGHFVLMRPKKALDEASLAAMLAAIPRYIDKEYDLLFQWSDDTIYCSELVWKIYQKADIELCPLKTFGDFKLDSEIVKTIVKKRYNADLPPLDEPVVAPSDLMESPLLKVVGENSPSGTLG